MNIVLIGAPLSGKGTQAERIQNDYKLVHISTGDMFREIMNQQTPLGKEVKKYMDKAMLVPDDLTIKVLQERLSRKDCLNGVLLDGFPRTLNQAQKLDKILKIDKAIYLKAELNELLERISGRFVCEVCKKTNTITDKNIVPCVYCGGNLTKRKDDTPEIVTFRFNEFMEQTYPIVEYYKKQNKLAVIEGEQGINEIYNKIQIELKKL